MEKYKKIIIILSAICLVFIICLILLIFINQKNNDEILSNNKIITTTDDIQPIKHVQEVADVKVIYNVGKCINDMIKDYYYSGQYFENVDVPLLPSSLFKKIDYDNGLKTYYIEKAYKADLENSIIIYFAKGYIVNERAEKIKREELLITLINDTEYNTARISLYGEGYEKQIKYSDDISQTGILDTSGFKIRKIDSGTKQLDEIIMEESLYQNRKLDENIQERDLLNWYYRDYKIKQADENNEKLELKGFLYEGNFESGYTITETDRTEYFIKPERTSMNYYIEKK